MTFSKPLYIEAFNSDRTHPHLWKKILLFLVLIIVQAALAAFTVDYTKELTKQGLTDAQAQQALPIVMVLAIIGVIIGSIIFVGITFLITLLIYKIFKKTLSKKGMFGGVLRYYNTILCATIIISAIQVLFHLDMATFKIDSLNIFAPGNTLLGAFSLTNLLSGWLFGVMLHSNGHLPAKWSWILGTVMFIICVVFTAISA
ncbi:YIP1 family protein [Staphylococcus delphini]|uniref:YIP1 family protein n=1 Tax=Staphylococcus delphini TaxID=53344 RepID=UPI0021D2B35A|nr:YIP1 family protein [Staphylococcus delphini]UXS29573.1 YIP1 family protein [Staphylococcus delphini]UXS44706.1 YIP1 family protein [Staphylococcus delphini]UXV45330.1 YIP1 family protein [Staphylococcus delphini]